MFLLLFSTLGVTVMYLGNNSPAAVSGSQSADYLNEWVVSTGIDNPITNKPIMEGLGATGTAATGATSTGNIVASGDKQTK